MALDTLDNGDSGLTARTKINAAIEAVNSAGLQGATIYLQANTTAGSPATTPPDLVITSSGAMGGINGRVYLTVNATLYVFYVGPSDAGDGSVWIDANSISDDLSMLSVLNGALSAAGMPLSVNYDGSGQITLGNGATGAAAQTTAYNDFGYLFFSGGGAGADAIPDSGGTLEVTLVEGSSGKRLGVVRAFVDGSLSSANPVGLYLRSGGMDTQIGLAESSDGRYEILPLNAGMGWWAGGKSAGESLVAKIIGSTSLDGSTCRAGVIYQLI